MTTYSAFFSSGLLAPHNATYHGLSSKAYPYYDAPFPTPTAPASPLLDSDMELELDVEREVTPTPNTPSRSHSTSSSSSNTNTCPTSVSNNPQPQPRLRKRRSSLTVASLPMNTIRSPARAAGAALQLQMHLASPSRSRSGSLSTTGQIDAFAKANMGEIASERTSLTGRMRSGSVGTALRPRRGVRRLASVPAAAPPPTVPLPAIPSLLVPIQDWNGPLSAPLTGSFSRNPNSNTNHPQRPNVTTNPRPPFTTRTHVSHASDSTMIYATQSMKGRDRSFSLSKGLRIDEEMKEN